MRRPPQARRRATHIISCMMGWKLEVVQTMFEFFFLLEAAQRYETRQCGSLLGGWCRPCLGLGRVRPRTEASTVVASSRVQNIACDTVGRTTAVLRKHHGAVPGRLMTLRLCCFWARCVANVSACRHRIRQNFVYPLVVETVYTAFSDGL